MQHTRRAYTACRVPCQFSSCRRWFKSPAALKAHLHAAHNHSFDVPNDSQPLPSRPPPDVVREYHEKLTGMSILFYFYTHLLSCAGRICNENGADIPEGTPPPPHTQGPDDWTPYRNRLEFETAWLLFSDVQMSAGKIDQLLHLWGSSLAAHQDTPPFADHQDLYNTIDATPIGDAPWKSFGLEYDGDRPSENAPSWMDKTYEVWYRDPQVVIKNIFANTDFDGEINYAPYHEFSADGSQRFKDFMSGEWAWDQAVRSGISPHHWLSWLLISF